MSNTFRSLARLGIVSAGLFSTAITSAANLVINPHFDQDLSAWYLFQAFDVTERWSPVDSANDLHSGSIQGTLPANGTFRMPIYAVQCVTVQPNKTYAIGATILLPGQTTPATAFSTIFANTYTNAGCYGNSARNIVAPNVTATNVWTPTELSVTTEAQERSVQLNLRVFAPSGTTLTSHFDDVYVIEIADGVFADDFGG
ncbi:hypothetical protein [Tahibacter amnicola]|uniref:CBM-cenC domain-containing protein n=1 Tax=Tahibacter amnicola TaxID=2976241 RepID=A0ABY6B7V2_9GAMM|nr:hypothetical protein [Tahibacter amnicola]UXI66168.1 hypothetical protein N4264_15575 [Tahibacter amnicola]